MFQQWKWYAKFQQRSWQFKNFWPSELNNIIRNDGDSVSPNSFKLKKGWFDLKKTNAFYSFRYRVLVLNKDTDFL